MKEEKKYTLTESEFQELLRQQRELCAENACFIMNGGRPPKIDKDAILFAPSPLLPTEEVGIKEDDLEASSCTIGNSIQQGETLYLYDSIEDRTMEEFSSIEEVEKFVRDCYVVDEDVHPDIESLNIYKKVGGVYVEETGGTIVRQDDIVPIVKVKVLLNITPNVPVSDTTEAS